jgi:hypothetical protein
VPTILIPAVTNMTKLKNLPLGRPNSDDNREINFIDIKPIVRYNNADVDKAKIFADNRNRLGVYRWINNGNGNTYVGSSISLSLRF